MRISDWSSDVCSSDLHARGRAITDYILDRTKNGSIASGDGERLAGAMTAFARMYEAHTAREDTVIFPEFKKTIGPKTYHELGEQFEEIEIGRASGRERVCQYV